jgi:hypothetical protein
MSTPDQYRAKAAQFTELAKAGSAPEEVREFQKLERSFTALADNEQWLADNHDKAVHAPAHLGGSEDAEGLNAPVRSRVDDEPEELHALERPRVSEVAVGEHILRCLGAALIMQWNTLPTKLQRELFDNAGAMGELLDTATLRGQIARFLHRRKDGADVRDTGKDFTLAPS